MNHMLLTVPAAENTDNLIVQVPIVGMLMVFAVLALLWAVLALSRVVLYDLPKKRAQESDASQAASDFAVSAPATAPVPSSAPVSASPDAALVAAITAAIAAAMEEEGYTGGFRVVSFRRADTGRAWNRK